MNSLIDRYARKRVDGLSVNQRVYRWILANGGAVTTAELAAAMGLSTKSANRRLQRGVKAGFLLPPTWTRRHRYRLVKGQVPVDGRGRTEGSQEALRDHWRPTRASLANLRHHAGLYPRPWSMRRHPLERAWK